MKYDEEKLNLSIYDILRMICDQMVGKISRIGDSTGVIIECSTLRLYFCSTIVEKAFLPSIHSQKPSELWAHEACEERQMYLPTQFNKLTSVRTHMGDSYINIMFVSIVSVSVYVGCLVPASTRLTVTID